MSSQLTFLCLNCIGPDVMNWSHWCSSVFTRSFTVSIALIFAMYGENVSAAKINRNGREQDCMERIRNGRRKCRLEATIVALCRPLQYKLWICGGKISPLGGERTFCLGALCTTGKIVSKRHEKYSSTLTSLKLSINT